jgi:hypothetical protein
MEVISAALAADNENERLCESLHVVNFFGGPKDSLERNVPGKQRRNERVRSRSFPLPLHYVFMARFVVAGGKIDKRPSFLAPSFFPAKSS